MGKSSLSDTELWNSIKDDDYRAFTTLFKRYWLLLYKTALHYIKDPEIAEEIVHDLFFNIWRSRETLQIDDFKSYLKAGTRYEVFRRVKKTRATPITYFEELPEEMGSSVLNKGEENIHSHELEQELELHLASLPGRCRQIFLLSRKDNLSNTEIATQLGISKRSVENQITAALKYLRNNLKNIATVIMLLRLLK
jgi:RNA polymerase sigma-70 factor (ECF subfamily)